MMVWIVSTDGYWDGAIRGRCAKDAEGVKRIVTEQREIGFLAKVRNIEVDFENRKVLFEEAPRWVDLDDEQWWGQLVYELIPIDVMGADDEVS